QEQTRTALGDLERDLAKSLGEAAFSPTLAFYNILTGEPAFQRSVNEVDPKDKLAGSSVQTFFRLAPVRHSPAPPDTELTFRAEDVAGVPPGRWDVALPAWLTQEGSPTVLVANAKEVRSAGAALTFPSQPLTPDGLVALDWNNDFRTD